MDLMQKTARLASVAGLIILGACAPHPLEKSSLDLRQRVMAAQQKQLEAVGDPGERTPQSVTGDSYLNKDPQRIEQLDKLSGFRTYLEKPLDVGVGLDGQVSGTVAMSLRYAIETAIKNNTDMKLARLQPVISDAQLVAAEAAFDPVLFATGQFGKVDRPQPDRIITSDPDGPGPFPPTSTTVGVNSQVADTATFTTGIRQLLVTGGTITASTGFEYSKNNTPGVNLSPDPAWSTNVTLGLEQPLLRNAGVDVNRAQIAISRNARSRDALNLHAQTLNTVAQVEQAYWELYYARVQLAIQRQLLQRTIDTRDLIMQREKLDVTSVQKAQAQGFVDARRGDIILAQRLVRDTSDRLKRLLRDPNLPLSSEALIVPIDQPIELSVSYKLLDALGTALQHRPETREALLNIDDASIRQRAADNARLPILNLIAQLQYNGLNDEGGNLGGSYGRLTDADYIEYIIGAQFEAPIGNRAAEATYQRFVVEKQAGVIQYMRASEEVLQSVKSSLRDLDATYVLIGVAREERRSQAEWLRTIEAREKTIEGLTPEFVLDQKLRAQQILANAELREAQAIRDYNVSLMRLYLSTGTLLEQNQIDVVWPEGMFND